jgi:uncharacterized Zn-finger protein
MTEQACAKRHYEITQADLPFSCPTRDMSVWDAHPRVYLPIEKVGKVICPYCGATYVLTDFNPADPATPEGLIRQEGGEK